LFILILFQQMLITLISSLLIILPLSPCYHSLPDSFHTTQSKPHSILFEQKNKILLADNIVHVVLDIDFTSIKTACSVLKNTIATRLNRHLSEFPRLAAVNLYRLLNDTCVIPEYLSRIQEIQPPHRTQRSLLTSLATSFSAATGFLSIYNTFTLHQLNKKVKTLSSF
jgi:hypothetical protein